MSGLRFFQLIFHPTNSATLIPNLFSKSFQRYPFARQNFADNRRGILLSKAGDWYKAGIKCSFYICLLGMGKNPYYLYQQGWWLYNLAQQVIFSTQVDKDNSVTAKQSLMQESATQPHDGFQENVREYHFYRFSYEFNRFR